MNENEFDYYYGNESEQFIFYRIPKVLFTDDRFKKLSTEAKVLYGLMLDRMGLSIKNQWCDDDNRVFIIYTQEESMEHLNCNTQKIVKLYQELDDIGLIERKRQGQGRPSWIYVKNFISNVFTKDIPENESDSDKKIKTCENHKSRNVKITNQDLRKSQVKDCENHKSRNVKITSADLRKSQCSNTDINDTDNSKACDSVYPLLRRVFAV